MISLFIIILLYIKKLKLFYILSAIGIKTLVGDQDSYGIAFEAIDSA